MFRFCSQPWTHASILENGNVISCSCPNWHTHTGYGNINEIPLTEIMRSSNANQFKKVVVDQEFTFCKPSVCGQFWKLSDADKLVENFDFVENLPKLPTNIMLGIDKNCNLKCASCRNSNIYSPSVNENAFNILKKLSNTYKDFDQPVEINCDGTGDVFASSAYQHWFRQEYIPDCFKFSLTTNGNLIMKNLDLIDQLGSKLQQVVVSLDAATFETYKKVRGGNFDIVLEGIQQLLNRRIQVLTQYVVQYENYKEILDYVALCKRLGVKYIGLQKITHWSHMTSDWWNANNLDQNPNVDSTFLKESLLELSKDRSVVLCGGLYGLAYYS